MRSSPGSPRWCHRSGKLADAAGALASSAPLAPGGLVRLLAGTVAFAGALLAVAVWRFERRDF